MKAIYQRRFTRIAILFFLLLAVKPSQAQKKYPSLLWEITGNGMSQPSYLYGTMHVSNKLAFYLGKPFFEALKSVDNVALELEPENWFDDVLTTGNNNRSKGRSSYGSNGSWDEYEEFFDFNFKVNKYIQRVYKEKPRVMNQLMFRFRDRSGDFEEETWLDMFIYQSASKLGKSTFGLETLSESNEMMEKARKEMSENPDAAEKLKRSERNEIFEQIELCYKKGDLDLLDSLSKRTSHPAFHKYILIERNKVFIRRLDSLMKLNSTFTGVGAAHLPGEEGCIEMLRDLGYTVKPVDMGKRSPKEKLKMEDLVLKRPLERITTEDGLISVESASPIYTLTLGRENSNFLTMDIPNGATFIVDRFMSHNSLSGKTAQELMLSIDSILYETIPGEIISKKKIVKEGHPAFDILNKTARGDIHRSQIIFLPGEIVVARLSGSGEKIKKGMGDHYFSSLKLNVQPLLGWEKRVRFDESIEVMAPGRMVTYSHKNKPNGSSYIFKEYVDDNQDLFIVRRLQGKDRGFLDEDAYELQKLAHGFGEDLDLQTINSILLTDSNRTALRVSYEAYRGKKVSCLFQLSGMGYHAFMAFTNDSTKTDRYFNSVVLRNPVYPEFFEYTDSAAFFTSKVPWEVKDKDKKKKSNSYRSYHDDDEVDATAYYKSTALLRAPTTTDEVIVKYNRFGKYYHFEDKTDFLEQNKNMLTRGQDFVVDKESLKWNESGYIADYWMSDTLTNRSYRIRQILDQRSVHTIQMTYDKHLGESDYALTFIENFKAIEDTLSTTSVFTQQDSVFLSDITSVDTLTFEHAHENLSIVHSFADTTKLEVLRYLAKNSSVLSEKEDKEEYVQELNDNLYLDKSSKNISSLKTSFWSHRDSAQYQYQIVGNLAKMMLPEGIAAAKELLLKEAPIGIKINSYNSFIGAMKDSLELSKVIFPELLELLSYDEYEAPILSLLAVMIEDSILTKEVYKTYLDYFVREAKVEFRRFKSTDKKKPSRYSHYNNAYNYNKSAVKMNNYWVLLYPYRTEKGPHEVFALAEECSKKHVVKSYALFNKRYGDAVSDTICSQLFDKTDTMSNHLLFTILERMDYLEDINWEKEQIKSKIKKGWSSYSYSRNDTEYDSITFIQQQDDSIRSRQYTTYFVKYLKTQEDKENWYVSVVMVNKEKKEYGDYKMLSSKKELDEDKEALDQYEEMRLKIIGRNRDHDFPFEGLDEGNEYNEEAYEAFEF